MFMKNKINLIERQSKLQRQQIKRELHMFCHDDVKFWTQDLYLLKQDVALWHKPNTHFLAQALDSWHLHDSAYAATTYCYSWQNKCNLLPLSDFPVALHRERDVRHLFEKKNPCCWRWRAYCIAASRALFNKRYSTEWPTKLGLRWITWFTGYSF
jgi:hypothetical protein